ncbi:MAG: hypothetical protein GY909_15725 [Oligoflexia bacterium]|nr:hypothetical protein [Oligoflexia bacterium]
MSCTVELKFKKEVSLCKTFTGFKQFIRIATLKPSPMVFLNIIKEKIDSDFVNRPEWIAIKEELEEAIEAVKNTDNLITKKNLIGYVPTIYTFEELDFKQNQSIFNNNTGKAVAFEEKAFNRILKLFKSNNLEALKKDDLESLKELDIIITNGSIKRKS